MKADKIFVSYRRRDSADVTGRIVEHLQHHFGRSRVFVDVLSIEGGARFKDVIEEHLCRTKVFVVVMGDTWVDAVDDTGKRRLEDEDDFVRYEVAHALVRPEVVTIPVRIDDQPVPKRADLPEDIQGIVERNAVEVRPDPDFGRDMADLCKVIERHVPRKRSRWPRIAAVLAAVVALALVALALIPKSATPVRVTIKGWTGYAPLYVANAMGLFGDTEVEFITVEDVDDAMKHLRHEGGKQADVGAWLVDSHVLARSNGIPAVAVLKLDVSLEADAMIAPTKIKEFHELKEKQVAYQKIDPSHSFLLTLQAKHKVKVKPVETNVEKAIRMFIDGDVVAAISYDPYLNEAEAAMKAKGKEVHRLFTGKDLKALGHPIVDILVVREDYLDAHRRQVKDILKGWFRAVDLLFHEQGPEHEQAVKYFLDFMGEYADKGSDYTEDDFRELTHPNQLEIADLESNTKYFERLNSEFRRQLANAHEHWKKIDPFLLGDKPFKAGGEAHEAGDGTSVLWEVIRELEKSNSR